MVDLFKLVVPIVMVAGLCYWSFNFGYMYPRYRETRLCDMELRVETKRHHFIHQEIIKTGIEGFRTFDLQYYLRFHHYDSTKKLDLGHACIRDWCYRRDVEVELRLNYPSIGMNDWKDAKQRNSEIVQLLPEDLYVERRYRFTYPRSLKGVRLMLYIHSTPKLLSQPSGSKGEADESEPNVEEIEKAFKPLRAYGDLKILPLMGPKESADLFVGQGVYVFEDDSDRFWPVKVTQK